MWPPNEIYETKILYVFFFQFELGGLEIKGLKVMWEYGYNMAVKKRSYTYFVQFYEITDNDKNTGRSYGNTQVK